MLTKHPQTTEPESKPNDEKKSVLATGVVGFVSSVTIVLLYLARIYPARWFLAASIALCLATVILRFTSRG